jgi:hypothetical protein
MRQTPDPLHLRIILDAEGGTCLWAGNERTKAQYGYAVMANSLPISPALCARIERLVTRHEATSLYVPFDTEGLSNTQLFGYEAQASHFAAAICRLAADLHHELGADFEIEHDFNAPAALVVGWNHRWTRLAAVASVAMTGLALSLAWALVFQNFGDLSDFGRVVLSAMFCAFALLFAGVAVTYAWASLHTLLPVLVVDHVAVSDSRLSRKPVPWSRIAQVLAHADGVQLLLAEAGEFTRVPLPANPVWAFNRLSAHLLGAPAMTVKAIGLAITPRAIQDAFSTYSEHS